MSFIDGKCFRFYPSEKTLNGGSLHKIQYQCADAYDKLPSMVGSQPIICFLILDCNKYSQVGSSLVLSQSIIRRKLFLGQYDLNSSQILQIGI